MEWAKDEHSKLKGIEAKLEGIKPELDIVGWSRWVVELFGYVNFRIFILAGGGAVWDALAVVFAEPFGSEAHLDDQGLFHSRRVSPDQLREKELVSRAVAKYAVLLGITCGVVVVVVWRSRNLVGD